MVRRNPAFYARWCRRECGMEDVARIDLRALAQQRDVEVYEAPAESFEGAAMVVDGLQAVFVNEQQIPQRYRFTFGHELGHLFLPWHRRLLTEGRQLVDRSVNWEGPAEGLEREANAFSAELLSPAHLVRRHVSNGAMDLSKALAVAEHFEMSLTSSALRVAQVAAGPVAVLLFRADLLQWRFQAEGFPYGLPRSGIRAPHGTVTADVVNGGDDVPGGVEVDGASWFLDRKYGDMPTTVESSIRLGTTGSVLTMVWCPE